MTTWRLLEADCVEAMAAMDESSVDAIVTDPPYHLTFMGRTWDRPDDHKPWAVAALRVLKPGGHLLAFGGTRTYHRLACALEDAGFEIRDCLAWLYGSGFPKSRNLNGEWKGWGTALKPAFEPIVLARKPLVGNVASNVQAFGTGALNIDGARIEGVKAGGGNNEILRFSGDNDRPWMHEAPRRPPFDTSLGRWPANVILGHSPDCDGGSESEEEWRCAPDCAVRLLDEQTGELPAGVAVRRHVGKSGGNFPFGAANPAMRDDVGYGDTGGASRFFYCPKADTSERNIGLAGDRNGHPTVKPIELMRWLCRLITPPGGTVLDPFTGSGSTGIAALREGFSFIGIEREPEYVEIARARIQGDAPLFNVAAELVEEARRR